MTSQIKLLNLKNLDIMIPYQVKAIKSPKTGDIKYYAQIAPQNYVDLDAITEAISNECTLTEHDIKAVLSALQEQVLLNLRSGNTVRLGDLGSFRLTLSSKYSDTAEEVSVDNIKALHVRFTKSARLNQTLAKGQRGISFGKPYTDEDGE